MKSKENKQRQNKEKKVRIYKANTHRYIIIALWVLLAFSFLFAIYKNFTAIDIHTIHETKVIEEKIVDTHKIENFVSNFAKVYYSWEQTAVSIEKRENDIKYYLTGELQTLNVDTVRKDIPVSSVVDLVQIWSVEPDGANQYDVTYTVDQIISDGKSDKMVSSSYIVTVYVDSSGNMVIIKNPTITSIPVKSGYTPKLKESDGTVDAITTKEINEFLITFFKIYPTATTKELSYYMSDGVLKPIGKDYVFSELLNPIYSRENNQVNVSVAVKYLDEQTKVIQVSQYNLFLEKRENNWIIVK